MKMKKFINYIYPSVRQDIRWHRIVKVIGWVISIGSLIFFPITFVIYFGVIQRAVFYVAYGDDKSKWLIQGHDHSKTSDSVLLSSTTKRKLKWSTILIAIFLVIVFAWIFSNSEQKSEEFSPKDGVKFSSYELGSTPVDISGFAWTVEKIWNQGNQLSDSRYSYLPPKYTTEGKFIEVVIRVDNKTNSSKSLLFDTGDVKFVIKDDKERVYTPLSTRTGYTLVGEREALSYENLGEYSAIQSVKSGIPYRFSVFFEVAKYSNAFTTIMTTSN